MLSPKAILKIKFPAKAYLAFNLRATASNLCFCVPVQKSLPEAAS